MQASLSDAPRPPESRLDSWKSIAVYLGRGVRTVQRWERDEGLPVHRLAHEKRGTVYADKHELDVWWESRRLTLPSETLPSETPPAEPEPGSRPVAERITWAAAATFWPAFSSDGRFVAYVSDGGHDGAEPQIWLEQVGGAAVCLTNTAADRSHLAFSADDTRIFFTAADDTGSNVYSMPTLGGAPRLVKRDATAARPSPDGKWLAYIVIADPSGVRIAAMDGSAERLVAVGLQAITFAVWSPDSRAVLVQGRSDESLELDYWIVPIDGAATVATGILQRARDRGAWAVTLPAAWIGDTVAFSAITPRGVTVWRQRLAPGTSVPDGEPEALTHDHEMDCFVTVAGARAAYVSARLDQNLWSIELDRTTGQTAGAMRRLTRGPGVISQLSVSSDAKTMAYFFGSPRGVGVMLRDLATGEETRLAMDQSLSHGFPAISPSGRQIAFATRSQGPRVSRPIYVAALPNGEPRQLGDDFGARPRQWIDERYVLVERFGARLLSVGVVDTVTGGQLDVLSGAEVSITNARVSGDGRWVAFDATRPGASPNVFVAPFRRQPIAPDAWVAVARNASHPFWSAGGDIVYYLPASPSREIRNAVKARHFDAASGSFAGEPITAFASSEMVIATMVTGAAPVATSTQLLLALADFRGDIWAVDV
jgi:Tol biopolymer transport system component